MSRHEGGAPKTRLDAGEIRGETRARVVLIGGGGAVTGTVSLLFSWVWYASRSWPPSRRVSPYSRVVLVLFSSLRQSRFANRARNSRDEVFFLPVSLRRLSAWICFSARHYSIIRSTFPEWQRMPRTCTKRSRVFTGNFFLTRGSIFGKPPEIDEGWVDARASVRKLLFDLPVERRVESKHALLFRGRDDYCADGWVGAERLT